MAPTGILETVVDREPLTDADGKSGALIERVTLADDRRYVVKHVVAEADWVMLATGDTGRVAGLHENGVFGRLPKHVESAIVGVEPTPQGCAVVMRDVSAHLFPDGITLTREQSLRLLEGASGVHRRFAGTDPSWSTALCDIADLYGFLSPAVARGLAADHDVPRLVIEGWERFHELVPDDVAAAIAQVLDRPQLLARAMETYPKTLIHGDFKLANLGLSHDQVIVLDWGALTSWAPAAVEFAWYLAINEASIDATLDELLADVGAVSIGGPDDPALPLALFGGLVQLGWNKGLSATVDDATDRDRELAGLAWWVARAREALDAWSPG